MHYVSHKILSENDKFACLTTVVAYNSWTTSSLKLETSFEHRNRRRSWITMVRTVTEIINSAPLKPKLWLNLERNCVNNIASAVVYMHYRRQQDILTLSPMALPYGCTTVIATTAIASCARPRGVSISCSCLKWPVGWSHLRLEDKNFGSHIV